jgi:hypothetical protein
MSGRKNIKIIKNFTKYVLISTLILLLLKIIGIIHCSLLIVSLPILIPASLIFILILMFIFGWGFVIVLNEIKYKGNK